ncbi:MAG: RNA 2',3'-cyclic phosphodiesterase [Gammaproteobacteria bacterium]
MAASKRLFFALWPDADGRGQLQARACDAVRLSRGRAMPAEAFHLTLAFLGEVDAETGRQLITAAGGIKPFRCSVELDRLEFWSTPRVFVAAASACPPELEDLHAELWRLLGDCGFTPEARRFRPHVTLARKAQVNPNEPFKSVTWSVRGFVLLASESGAGGPHYSVLQGFAGATPGRA